LSRSALQADKSASRFSLSLTRVRARRVPDGGPVSRAMVIPRRTGSVPAWNLERKRWKANRASPRRVALCLKTRTTPLFEKGLVRVRLRTAPNCQRTDGRSSSFPCSSYLYTSIDTCAQMLAGVVPGCPLWPEPHLLLHFIRLGNGPMVRTAGGSSRASGPPFAGTALEPVRSEIQERLASCLISPGFCSLLRR
jgi:hypothetical protein